MWDCELWGEWHLLVERDLNDPHAAAMWDCELWGEWCLLLELVVLPTI